jgi:hypothetical protein
MQPLHSIISLARPIIGNEKVRPSASSRGVANRRLRVMSVDFGPLACLCPDSGGIADVCQPLLGAMRGPGPRAETRRLPLVLVRAGVGAESVTRLKTLLPTLPRCRDQPPLGLPPTKPPRLFGPGSL